MMFFWDINRTLTYNALFNFVVGNRGAGKTYGFKTWAIRDFIKTKSQFIYIRRYKEEFKKLGKFFVDIAHDFPGHELKVDGKTFFIDGEEAGYALTLSTAKVEKSNPFPNVNKIGFDEFIIDRGVYHYLPDEVVSFLELYETVARMRDVRVFFLSNAITVSNPYFMYFDLEIPRNNAAIARPRKDVILELVANPEFIEAKKRTRFGQLIAGTKYSDYAIDNKFLRDNNSFIDKKSGSAKYGFGVLHMGQLYGVWMDYNVGRYWVSNDVDPVNEIIYTISQDDHTPNTMLIKGINKIIQLKRFVDNYRMNNVYYEDIKIKNTMMNMLKMMLV